MRSSHYFHLADLPSNPKIEVVKYNDSRVPGCYLCIGMNLSIHFENVDAIIRFAETIHDQALALNQPDQPSDLCTKE